MGAPCAPDTTTLRELNYRVSPSILVANGEIKSMYFCRYIQSKACELRNIVLTFSWLRKTTRHILLETC